jgi:glycine cleavage system H protein
MSDVPNELKYAKSHEWVRNEGDGTVTVGISDHAQEMLGDLVFVELPEVDSSVDAGGESAVVESVKAASDVYSPVSGQVVEVNQVLADTPETINQDPFGEGWMFKIKMSDPSQLDGLLDAAAYSDIIESEEH